MAIDSGSFGGFTQRDRPAPFSSTSEENELHKFASYNYVFTLSGLTRAQLASPKRIHTDPLHDIIARTGGIGDANKFANPNFSYITGKSFEGEGSDEFAKATKTTETQKKTADFANRILRQNRDLYFERCEITSVPGPNVQRKLMNYTTIEMMFSEPNGISLWQKCRAAAFNGGYLEHTSAPFLLTIEFKGFDSLGNEVANNIVRRLPIQLARSSIQVGAGGVTYTVGAVPWTEVGSQNRYLFTRAQGTIEGKGNDLSSYLKDFQEKLLAAQEREVKENLRQHVDEYKITADPAIGTAVNFFNSYRANTGDEFKLAAMTYGKDESVGFILEKFVRQFDQYRQIDKIVENYWRNVESATAYDSEAPLPAPWVPWFKVVTTCTLTDDWDSKLMSHKRKIHFHIKTYQIHVANFAQVGLAGYDGWKNVARKKYQYIYTGQNLDILDLNVEYNSNYVKANLLSATPEQKNNTTIFDKVSKFFSNIFSGGANNSSANGVSPFSDPDLPLSGVVTTSDSVDATTRGGLDANQVSAFYDFLTNNYGDMVNIDMKIMGDPAYIGEDYFTPMSDPGENNRYSKREQVGSVFGFDWDSQKKQFNFDEYQPVVSLDFRFPTDFDEKQGLYEFTREGTPQFTGLYKVIRVVSTFENGQFTQNLNMIRFENQSNLNGASGGFKQKSTSSTEAQAKGGSGVVTVEDVIAP